MRLVNKLIPLIAFFPKRHFDSSFARPMETLYTCRDEYMELPRSAILTDIGGGIPQSLSGVTMYVIG
jgi:hypothetical protein